MILLIGIIVSFIALIVFIVLSAKKTHWMNLVGVFFVYLFAVFYLLMAGMVIQTNSNWKKVAERNQKKLDDQERDLEVALTGQPTDYEWPTNSLKGLETLAAQQVLGQGRVWRQCEPGAFQAGANADDLSTGSLTVTLPPGSPAFKTEADPAAGADDAVESISLVYVFLEEPDGAGGYKISNYIGSFFATNPADDNTSVTLSPSLILPDPGNLDELKASYPDYKTAKELVQAAGAGETRWALYDILPVDTYDVFVESIRAEEDDPKMDVTAEMLKEKLMGTYMPSSLLRLSEDSDAYKQIINSIAYTDSPLQDYVDSGFEPSLDETWYKIKFNRALKKENGEEFAVDVSGESALAPDEDEGQAFDIDGLAKFESLKWGETVTFDKDEWVMFDHESWEGRASASESSKKPLPFIKAMKETAEGKKSADAEKVEEIYRRKLNDFDYEFRSLITFNNELAIDRKDQEKKVEQLELLQDQFDKEIQVRNDEKNSLSADKKEFQSDLDAIADYQQNLNQQLTDERNEIDRYFRLTRELAAKKLELQEKFEELVDEKTKEAEAAANEGQ